MYNESKKSILYGVSLGPGDPDLITVKGLSVLKKVDKIYYPGSLYKDGTKASYSEGILEYYKLPKERLIGYYLEMTLARAQAVESYQQVFEQIQVDIANGLSVAVVAEGDNSTYSSFSYLLTKAQAVEIETVLVPGITSYTLNAALHQEPLCLQNEKFVVLPRVASTEHLQEALSSYDTVVLMKINNTKKVLEEVLPKENYKVFYGERLGTTQQYVSRDWNEIKNREIPYFSLMMIKK